VVGTSSGALAAALLANGYDSFEIATGAETFPSLDL
jgi:predicted acylesterase/phospholipase RssA